MTTRLIGLVCIAFILFVAASAEHADESETTARAKTAAVAEPAPVMRGTLTVEALKISQSAPSFTGIDIRFTNTSAQAIDWWIIGVEVYDEDGNYLGRGDGIVTDIAPGQSRVHPVVIETQAHAINSWKVTLNTVRGYGSFENLVRFYRLDAKVKA